MKKFLALSLVLIMVLGLVACGGSSAPASSGDSGKKRKKPLFKLLMM